MLVEDAAELRPVHPHVVALQARTSNVEGAGAVGLRDLVRQALRMRPDRLVVGECRGAEVVDLLGALNTGHEGGAGTLHANAPGDVPARLEALGLLGGLPRAALHAQVAAALQVVLQVRRTLVGPGPASRSACCCRAAPTGWWPWCRRGGPGTARPGGGPAGPADRRAGRRRAAGARRVPGRPAMSWHLWSASVALLGLLAAATLPARVRRRRRLRALRPGVVRRLRRVAPAAGWRRAQPHRAGGVGRLGALGSGIAGGAGGRGRAGGRRSGRVGVAVGYAGLLVRGWRRRRRARSDGLETGRALDALGALAADLRAGLPPVAGGEESAPDRQLPGHVSAVPGGQPATADRPMWRASRARRLAGLAGAAIQLAAATGAPLADLLERIEADARLADRAAAAATAQAAGAQATAWLLAALPLGGDRARLRASASTRWRCCCARRSAPRVRWPRSSCQVAGLLWAERLARLPGDGAGVTGHRRRP